MKRIAVVVAACALLACGSSEDEAAKPAAPPAAPAQRQAPPAGFGGAIVWGGEGPAPSLDADIAECQKKVAADPRAAKASEFMRFAATLKCLEEKGWRSRDQAQAPQPGPPR
jgi:hypothetical protein